jgi:hypothetical protein
MWSDRLVGIAQITSVRGATADATSTGIKLRLLSYRVSDRRRGNPEARSAPG